MPGVRLRSKWQKLTRQIAPTDTPWTTSMSSNQTSPQRNKDGNAEPESSSSAPQPTVAAFSPNQQTTSNTSTRASVIIHQKTPLLGATPPQVTRALAYSHPFILPLNHVAGLLSWTTGDAWESFLLLAIFWFVVLYGDSAVRWAGPLVSVLALMVGMYSRRYSPLSSTVWSGGKTNRKRADSQQRKSLDEILDTLQTFTSRCDLLLDPFLSLTEFLSTQSTATSATTRPALISLFLRILAVTPIWMILALPPLRIITAKRVVLIIGSIGLSWHSTPARVTRTILWRSRTVRRLVSLVTGLHLAAVGQGEGASPIPTRNKTEKTTNVVADNAKPGVRFTFSIYENQRRWLGLGWTASLLAYERQAWTDDQMNPCSPPQQFELPETENERAEWRWVPESKWHVEGSAGKATAEDDVGWTYYDNKWQHGQKIDGWGRYTRRRKWIRDAELVEVTPDGDVEGETATTAKQTDNSAKTDNESVSKRKPWFGGSRPTTPRRATNDKMPSVAQTAKKAPDAASGKAASTESARSRDGPEEDVHTPIRYRQTEWDRSIGEGVMEGLS